MNGLTEQERESICICDVDLIGVHEGSTHSFACSRHRQTVDAILAARTEQARSRCDACGDTRRVRWMSEGDPNGYMEADGDGMVPCPDCAEQARPEHVHPAQSGICTADHRPFIAAVKAEALREAAESMPGGQGTDYSYWDGVQVEYEKYETSPNNRSPQKWLRDRADALEAKP